MERSNPPLTTLKEYRKKSGLTIREVGVKLGISRSMYGHIETGEKRLSYKTAVSLAKIFKTTPDTLFLEDYEEFFKDSLI